MKLFSAILGALGGGERDPNGERWWLQGNVPDLSTVVREDTVVQIPEVYACLQVLAQTIGALPLFLYERQSDGSKKRIEDAPVAGLLRGQANEVLASTAFEFRSQMTWDLALHRNAFAEIIAGRSGPVSELVRIDPLMVTLVQGQDARRGDYVYEVREGARTRRILRDEMFHLKLPPFTSDGLMGRSLIRDGHRTFQRALALEDFARRFFENDATPGLVITMPGRFKSRADAEEYRQKWINQFGRSNRGKPAVLDQGGKVATVPIENNKAQYIETQREVALQVVRLWRMPPHKVGILDRATFTNIEQQSLEFVTDCLLPLLVAWEQGIKRDLLLLPNLFAEHNVAGLLRGDLKARYEAYAIGRNWGWISVNDVRALENMNPVPNGDVYLQPLNMAPAGSDTALRGPQPAQQAPGAMLAAIAALENVLARRMLPGIGD